MIENGWLKLYRSLLKWEWYDDINTKVVFLHLLLTVSIEDGKWHGIEVKRGSRIISFSKLAKETKLTIREVRTAISHLETTSEVTRIPYKNFSVISLKNFDKFQEMTNKSTNERQSSDKRPTNERQQYKKVKEDKEGKERKEYILGNKSPEQARKAFVPPSVEEVRAYCSERENGIDPEYFVDYYTANGWTQGKGRKPIKDWKATIRTWERNDSRKKNQTAEGSAASGADSRIYEGII